MDLEELSEEQIQKNRRYNNTLLAGVVAPILVFVGGLELSMQNSIRELDKCFTKNVKSHIELTAAKKKLEYNLQNQKDQPGYIQIEIESYIQALNQDLEKLTNDVDSVSYGEIKRFEEVSEQEQHKHGKNLLGLGIINGLWALIGLYGLKKISKEEYKEEN
jgi:hypothetical protein